KSAPGFGTCTAFIGAIPTFVVAMLPSAWKSGLPLSFGCAAAPAGSKIKKEQGDAPLYRWPIDARPEICQRLSGTKHRPSFLTRDECTLKIESARTRDCQSTDWQSIFVCRFLIDTTAIRNRSNCLKTKDGR